MGSAGRLTGKIKGTLMNVFCCDLKRLKIQVKSHEVNWRGDLDSMFLNFVVLDIIQTDLIIALWLQVFSLEMYKSRIDL